MTGTQHSNDPIQVSPALAEVAPGLCQVSVRVIYLILAEWQVVPR
jgi:hypothetical protein